MYNEQYYRTLAFLAGFGAAGALGCEAVMEEEKYLPELPSNHHIPVEYQSGFHHVTGRGPETTVTGE